MVRKIVIMFFAFSVFLSFIGCATHKKVSHNKARNGSEYSMDYWGILSDIFSSDDAVSVATADRIRANADYTRAQTTVLLEGGGYTTSESETQPTVQRSKFNVLFINQSVYPILRIGLSVPNVDGQALKEVVRGDGGVEFCINDRRFVAYAYTPEGNLIREKWFVIKGNHSIPFVDGKRYSMVRYMQFDKGKKKYKKNNKRKKYSRY